MSVSTIKDVSQVANIINLPAHSRCVVNTFFNLLTKTHCKLHFNQLLIGHTSSGCGENVIHLLIIDVLLHMDIYILCFILQIKCVKKVSNYKSLM